MIRLYYWGHHKLRLLNMEKLGWCSEIGFSPTDQHPQCWEVAFTSLEEKNNNQSDPATNCSNYNSKPPARCAHLYNTGLDIMGIINCFLIRFEACSIRLIYT